MTGGVPEHQRARVLVTGATGFLGGALVRRLVASGASVRALVRAPAQAEALVDQGIDPVLGAISDAAAIETALEGVAVVYHLAGKLLQPGEAPIGYRRTHVEGTTTLLDRCRAQPGIERFVHCSTTGVLGVTGDTPADETTAMRPTNVYEQTKAEAELAVRAALEDGFPAVIVRPGLVYGPGDLHLVGFFRAILRRQFRPIGRRPVWLHPIYIDDMTEALVRCGERSAAIGECFHIAGPESVTLERLAAVIAEAGGTTLPRRRIPLPAARAMASVGDILPARLMRVAPLTTSRLDFLTHSRVYSVSKAEERLGFVAATGLRTGVQQSVEWYREHGYLPSAVRVP